MTKKCPECGNENPDNSSFCKNCGADLKGVSATPKPAAKPSKGGPTGWWSEQSSLVKALSVIGICCVGLIIVAGIGGLLLPDSNTNTSTTPTTAPTTPAQTEATWHSVANFTGTGNKETDSFTTKGQKFKVKITANTDSMEYALISFFAYPEGETKMYVGNGGIDSFSKKSQTDEFIVNASPGKYYLTIIAANLKNWKVEVLDYY